MAVNKKERWSGAEISIEKMTESDLPQVLVIEQISFPIPFTEHLFRMELRLDVAHLYVARMDAQVVGYIDFWKVLDEIHLITIAVHSDWRKRKIGSQLLDFMIQDARSKKMRQVTLDVRPSNAEAITLYRKFGFVQVGVRQRYYQDNNEDALVMSLDLSSAPLTTV